MLSIPDMAIAGALALILFGPEQLPKVARKVGHIMRDVQNTSQSFIREIERAADEHDVPGAHAVPDYPEYTPPAETAMEIDPSSSLHGAHGAEPSQEQPTLFAVDEYGIPAQPVSDIPLPFTTEPLDPHAPTQHANGETAKYTL